MRISHIRRWSSYFALLIVYYMVFACALQYSRAWMQPEEFFIKGEFLKSGWSLNIHVLAEMFDTAKFEFSARSSRPLSTLFDLFDSKFRSFLWTYFLPHPSLSLTFFFTLFLTPWLLFRLLRIWELPADYARFLVAFSVGGTANLSLIAMHFRPAKALANFSIVLCLFLGAKFLKKERDQGRHERLFSVLLGILFLGFFWDETALLAYPILPLLLPGLFNRRRVKLYLSLPLLYVIACWGIIPVLGRALGFGHTHFFRYEPLGYAKQVFGWEFLRNLGTNGWVLWQEMLGTFPVRIAEGGARFAITLAWISSAALVLAIGYAIYETRKNFTRSIAFRALIILIASGVFHGLLMLLSQHKVWGPYWYGVYLPIFVVLFLGHLAKLTRYPAAVVLPLIFCLPSVWVSFPYLNHAYRRYHFDFQSPNGMTDVFTNRINRFQFKPESRYEKIKEYWESPSKLSAATTLPRELLYLPIELRVPNFDSRSVWTPWHGWH